MTDRIALGLGLGLLALIAGDLVLNGGAGLMFLLRRLFELVEYLSFWR
ncbi:MAG TPA: hypothetical protein VLA78_14410 [Paracoccaceae bacterium]|jgi:hypothetical protein|nr:hypothetical protein [Paracoccaceae bacterium]